METIAHIDTLDYLARFASAVVPNKDYYIKFDELEDLNDKDSIAFEVFLKARTTFNFKDVDPEGSVGMILYFDDIMIPNGDFVLPPSEK